MNARHISDKPLISVIVANYCGANYLRNGLESVQSQTHSNLEILVVDDASLDDSLSIIEAIAQSDPRVRVLSMKHNGGPARARNRALDAATGEWVAIVDSDDQIHPERFERLLLAAEASSADIVVDDLLHFYEDGGPVHFLLPADWTKPTIVTAQDWILGGSAPHLPALGYLKPLMRATVLGRRRYDEALRIGEDFDLILRLLLDGALCLAVPQPWYLYRRHSRSISHRLTTADLDEMIAADDRVLADFPQMDKAVIASFARRRRGLVAGRDFQSFVDALKRRDWVDSLVCLAANPSLALRLAAIFRERYAVPARDVSFGRKKQDIDIPDYVRPDMAFAPPVDRVVWRDLVTAAMSGTLVSDATNEAGLYASGFVPRGEPLLHEAKAS